MDKTIIGFDFGDNHAFPCFIEGFDPDTKVGGTVHKLIPSQYDTGIPTVYFYSKKKGALCGYDAVSSRATPPDNRICCLRRELGLTRTVDDKRISVDEAITEVIQYCVRIANAQLLENFRKTTNLVSVAYPAEYSPQQRDRLRALFEKATLEDGTPVKVCSMIAEPAAVALDYLTTHGKADKETTFLIYDLSTGHFEASLVAVYPKGRLSGDGTKYYDIIDFRSLSDVGSVEFDEKIVELLLEKIDEELSGEELTQREKQHLRDTVAEKAKIELSEMDVVYPEVVHDDEVLDIEITREEFEEKTKPILRPTIRLVKDMLKAHPEILPERIILSGGGCEMPMVETSLKKYLKEYSDKIVKGFPEFAVAAGTARYGIWAPEQEKISLSEDAGKPTVKRGNAVKGSRSGSTENRSANPSVASENRAGSPQEPKKHSPQELYAEGEKYYYGKGVPVDFAKAAEYYREAGDLGHTEAQFSLGYCYADGKGVTKSYEKAAEWYRKAAERGHAGAQCNLGYCYDCGNGVAKDAAKAVEWYRRAAIQGQIKAQYNLGYCYYVGQGVKQNYDQAAEWFRKAADQKNAGALYYLGCCYEQGQGVNKDAEMAAEWYRKGAEQGHAGAQYKIAYSYEFGKGVEKNPDEAFKWYQKSAAQGNNEAQYRLGYCYEYGRGVKQDDLQAYAWYHKAAEQNHAEAQYSLGYCYEHGKGVTKDSTKAVGWYRKAAVQGHASAQCNLGYCYDVGRGITQNLAVAVEWYRKAAKQDHAQAQHNLACCYDQGKGVMKDPVQAAQWFRKAAEQGVSVAQYSLALCYEYGDGVATNEAEAIHWHKKASNQGHENAKKRLKKLKRKNRVFTLSSLIAAILLLFVFNGGALWDTVWSVTPLALGKATEIRGFGYSMTIFTVLTVLAYLVSILLTWAILDGKAPSGFKAKKVALLLSIGMWYAGYGLTHWFVKITWGYYVFATLLAIITGVVMGCAILFASAMCADEGINLFHERCAKLDVRFITSMLFFHIGFCGLYAMANDMGVKVKVFDRNMLALIMIGSGLFSLYYAIKRIVAACAKYANRDDVKRKRNSEVAIFVLTLALAIAFFLANYKLNLFAENETLRMLTSPFTFTLPFVLFFRFVAIVAMNKKIKK